MLIQTQEGTATRKTAVGDKISMHYRGTLPNDGGKQFDASYDRGEPLSFTLGAGQVIKGWDQGLVDMAVGEKRTLTIPPELGYGSRGFPGAIPPNSVLSKYLWIYRIADDDLLTWGDHAEFETELVSIKGKDEL